MPSRGRDSSSRPPVASRAVDRQRSADGPARYHTGELPTRLLAAPGSRSALSGCSPGSTRALAIAAALGLAFVVLVVADLTFGSAPFAVLAFLDRSRAGGRCQLRRSARAAAGDLLARDGRPPASASSRKRSSATRSSPRARPVRRLGRAQPDVGRGPGAALDALMRYAPNPLLFLIVFTGRAHAAAVASGSSAASWSARSSSAAYGLVGPGRPGGRRGRAPGGRAGNANELAAVAGGRRSSCRRRWRSALRGRRCCGWRAAVVVPLCALACSSRCRAAGWSRSAVALIAAVVVARPLALRRRSSSRGRRRCSCGRLLQRSSRRRRPRERVTELEGGTGRTDIWTVGWRMVEDKPARRRRRRQLPGLLDPLPARAGRARARRVHRRPAQGRAQHLPPGPRRARASSVSRCSCAIILFALVCMLERRARFARMGDRDGAALARAVRGAGRPARRRLLRLAQYSKQLWLLLALGPALLEISRAQLDTLAAESPQAPDNRGQLIAG